jgi:hypothetical protein
MPEDALRPARRFLHVCYCCSDASSVTSFFVDHLAMRNTMNTTGGERSSGAILGIEGEVLSAAAFVYDARGPRTSAAIEVQGWIEPPLVGTPVEDPAAAGIQALGFPSRPWTPRASVSRARAARSSRRGRRSGLPGGRRCRTRPA